MPQSKKNMILGWALCIYVSQTSRSQPQLNAIHRSLPASTLSTTVPSGDFIYPLAVPLCSLGLIVYQALEEKESTRARAEAQLTAYRHHIPGPLAHPGPVGDPEGLPQQLPPKWAAASAWMLGESLDHGCSVTWIKEG